MRRSELNEVVEPIGLDPLETDSLYHELEKRAIEIVDDVLANGDVDPAAFPSPLPLELSWETTTDALQLFLREAGRSPLPHRGPGGRAREADRARRPDREAADDPVESAARRLDREELPQPGAPFSRPDPGGHARPDPCGREVRLAPRLQVLHLRHLVDPPGGRARARGQGAGDPDAGPHRRADAQDEPGRAAPLDRARPRADARGDRRGGEPADRACQGGAGGSACELARRAGRRGRRRGPRRLRLRQTSRCPTSSSRTPCARSCSPPRCGRSRLAIAT